MKLLDTRTVTVFVLAVTVLTLGGCALISPGEDAAEPTPVPTVISGGTVSAVGRLVPQRSAVLGLAAGGDLAELPVAEGALVQEGDLLASTGDRQAQEAALAEAIHAQSLLDTTAFRDRLDDKNVALTKAQDALDKAREELDKHLDLDPANATRKRAQTAFDKAQKTLDDAVYARDSLQNQLDLAEAGARLAIERLADAERRRDATQDGPDADQLALAQARLAAADAAVAAAERGLELTKLAAPFAGIVVDLHGLEPGMLIAAGAPVATLADLSVWFVETTDLTELDVVRVSVGQKATVVPDALGEISLAGVVESIAAVPAERSGDVLYTVRIRLDESDPRLRWGMTMEVTLEQ